MSSIQWGNVGEWAAAVGTSAAVLLTAASLRRDRQDRREQEALRVAPGLGPVGGSPGTEGVPTTVMQVSVSNQSNRTITDIDVVLESDTGEPLDAWHWEEIAPGMLSYETRVPADDEWSRQPGRTFRGKVRVTFRDSDGHRWLRDSNGKIRSLKGRRRTPELT